MARLREKIQLKNIPLDKIEMPAVPLDRDLLNSLNFEAVRNYQAEFMPELDIENEVKPGLFLTSEQVKKLLTGESVEVKWQDRNFRLIEFVYHDSR